MKRRSTSALWNGETLCRLRQKRGLTQIKIAEKLTRVLGRQISQPTYSNWENAGIEPKGYPTLKALAEICHCEVEDFFGPGR